MIFTRSVWAVAKRFRVWTKGGVWERILLALIEQDLVDETTLMLDSIISTPVELKKGVS